MKKALVLVSKSPQKKVIEYYLKNFKEYPLFVVSPSSNIQFEDKYLKFNHLNDNHFLRRNDFPLIDKTHRPNWYFQQFLKYKIVQKLDYDIIQIIDGDSFVSENIILKNSIFYTEKKIHPNYSNFIHHLFKTKDELTNRNFITNQMCFKRKYVFELLNLFSPDENDWINVFCKILIKNPNFWFSEYQLYSEYVIQKEHIKEKQIKVFRRFDLIDANYDDGFKKYHVLAIEPQHKTDLLRKLRANLYYNLGINLG